MDIYCDEQMPGNDVDVMLQSFPDRITEKRSYDDQTILGDSRVVCNMLELESSYALPFDYFASVQTEIKCHMRKTVVDWMLEVCEEEHCQPDVFTLAVSYLDRFLCKRNIGKSQFQLLACVCLFLASKFKETVPISSQKLVAYTDYSITLGEMRLWEMTALGVLDWDLSSVTPNCFLEQLLRRNDPAFDGEVVCGAWNMEAVRRHAETFVALTATEFSFCEFPPSVIAAASLVAAFRGLRRSSMSRELFWAVRKEVMRRLQVDAFLLQHCVDRLEITLRSKFSSTNCSQQSVPKPIPSSNSSKQAAEKTRQTDYGPHLATTPTEVLDVAYVCG